MITAKCINNINPYDNGPELDIEINKFYEVEEIVMGTK